MTLAEASKAIRDREPIFHRPELGTRREDFDGTMATDFYEIGASGKCYTREFILETLEERHRALQNEEHLEVSDFVCRQLADDLYLATYTLLQPPSRVTRRGTIWRYEGACWKIVYHQGTMVSS